MIGEEVVPVRFSLRSNGVMVLLGCFFGSPFEVWLRLACSPLRSRLVAPECVYPPKLCQMLGPPAFRIR